MKRLWAERQRHPALEIALSRRIDTKELERDEILRGIYMVGDPDKAYGMLLMQMSFERQHREAEARRSEH